MVEERKETLQQYVGDMIGIERYVLDLADGQLDDKKFAPYSEVEPVVRQLRSTMDEHVRVMRQHLERLGGSTSTGFKETMTSAFGSIIEMFQKARSEEASKMLRDHYTALSLTAISYGMLQTTALAMGDRSLADVSAKHLKDITPLIAELGEVIPTVVARELTDRAPDVDPMAAQEAVRTMESAWHEGLVHTGHTHGG